MMSIYNTVVHALPQDEANIKSVRVKFSMSVPIKITDKAEVEAKVKEKKKSKYKERKAGKKEPKEKVSK